MIFVDRKAIPKPEFFMSKKHEEMVDAVNKQMSTPQHQQKQSRIHFDLKVLQKAAREPLFKLFKSKCAYCEQPLTNSNFAIDHFRPVSLYPKLAYQWENLYLACSTCNRHKGQRFPIQEDRSTDSDQKSSAVASKPMIRNPASETALLIDPCKDRPEYHLHFDEEGGVSSISFEFRDLDPDGKVTINTLGLDRSDLCIQRRKVSRNTINYCRISEAQKNLRKQPDWFTEIADHVTFAAIRRQIIAHWITGQSKSWSESKLSKMLLGGLKRRYPDLIKVEETLRRKSFWGEKASAEPGTKPKVAAKPRHQKKSTPASKKKLKGKLSTPESATPSAALPPSLKPPFAPERRILLSQERDTLPINNAVIKAISIQNFKAIHSLELNPVLSPTEEVLELEEDETSIPTLAGWMTLLGENGSGKSSVLQAVSLALAGKRISEEPRLKPERFLMRGKRSGKVVIELTLGEPIILKLTKRKFSFEAGGEPHGAFVRAYGSTRLLPTEQPDVQPAAKTPRVEYINMFDPFTPLIDADTWLSLLDDDEEFLPARLAIKDLLGLEDREKVEKVGSKIFVDGQPLENLSAGYQTIVALACDIMAGIPESLSDMQQAQGIVLIDEIGAHLHPRWKMRIASRLRKAFPLIQFIVSTHEPLCLRGHSIGEVFVVKREALNTDKPEERVVSTENNLPSPRRLRVDQLLTSKHFGLDSTIDPVIDRKFNEYYQLLAKKDQLIKDNNQEKLDRCAELSMELAHYGVLGYTRRDQLVYEIIDEFLAHDSIAIDRGPLANKVREERRDQVKRKVIDLWRYAKSFDLGQGT